MSSAFTQAVGRTPLLRLKYASARTGCNIFAKAEYSNPGGSIKDRAALWIVKDAEERGVLVPGQPGVIVEGTAGNTGIGLALAAATNGYQCVICIAETQSPEKKAQLRWAGAQLVEVPAVPFKNPNNYVHVAERLAQEIAAQNPGMRTLYANQWDNLANRRSHTESTGPEIAAQLRAMGIDHLDSFSCAAGTGGTISGTGEFLRTSFGKSVKVHLTDPCGASLVRYFNTGELLPGVGGSISEGIGQSRITGNLKNFKPDGAFEVTDAEMMEALHGLQVEDGLVVGGSSGINVAGAIRVAQQLGPGHTLVTILADSGARYAGKLFNPAFLNTKGLKVPPWLDEEVIQTKYDKFLRAACDKAIKRD